MRMLWLIAGRALLNGNFASSFLKEKTQFLHRSGSEMLSFRPPCLFFWFITWLTSRLCWQSAAVRNWGKANTCITTFSFGTNPSSKIEFLK